MEKLNVRLVISEKMTANGGENDVLRTTKRFRDTHDFPGKSVSMRTEKYSIRLKIKKAWAEEAKEQYLKFKKGQITKAQLNKTTFVSAETFHNLVGNRRKKYDESCYVSNDLEALMIGADPEFGLTDALSGKLMYASKTGSLPAAGELGHDGPMAEVRPNPYNSMDGIITNMSEIFGRAKDKIDRFGWVSGASYRNKNNANNRVYHMGGHIHIGDPSELPTALKKEAYRSIIHVLDELVALPMVRIDTPEPEHRRNETWEGYGKYGRWGDQRPQVGRFEWRVLSGIWLCHPDMARAVLGTTKAVSEACYQMMAEKDFNPEYLAGGNSDFLKSWNLRDSSIVADKINSAVPGQVTKAMAATCVKKLNELPNFKSYQSEIEEFERLVSMSVSDRKLINLDLKDSWTNQGKLIKEN